MGLAVDALSIFLIAGLPILTTAQGHCSREQDGNIVIQAEDTPLSSGWKIGRNVEGYTGRGYITWFGENQYQFEEKGMLKYEVCATGGVYKVNIWSMRETKFGLRDDEGNDVWIKVRDEWIKLFSSFGSTMRVWKLSMSFDVNGEKEEPLIYLNSGCQHFEVAARSEMYSLDRFILVKAGSRLDMNMGVTTCTVSAESSEDEDTDVSEDDGSGNSDDSEVWDSTIRPPLCAMLPALQTPDKTIPIDVTFKNSKGYPIQIYKRTKLGQLIFLGHIDAQTPMSTLSVSAYLYDSFAATRTDGTCLRSRMVAGISGKFEDNVAQFLIL